MKPPVRILLVEDEPLWQQGIQALLMSDARFQLAGTADHFEQAVDLFEKIQPQAVLLDWKIKGNHDGLAVGEFLIGKGLPPERIVLISGSDPGVIPRHPFLFVPKSRISIELLPLLENVTIN